MEEKKKRLFVNGLVYAAKMVSIVLPSPAAQIILQESVDLLRDKLLEITGEMPQVDDVLRSYPPVVQNVVENILSTPNVFEKTEDLCYLNEKVLVSNLMRQSGIIRQVSQEEEHQVEKALTVYFEELKTWAVKQPKLLQKYFEYLESKLSTHEKKFICFRVGFEEQQKMISECDRRITALENTASVELSPLDDMCLSNNKIFDDTSYYCNKFEETLFLHRRLPEEDRITLKDIYILPSANVEAKYQWNRILRRATSADIDQDKEFISIAEAIYEFIEYEPQTSEDAIVDILFIEGKAAMGKSSLISWLCWHYINANKYDVDIDEEFDTLKGCMDKHRLITIKLRDLPYSDIAILNTQSPFLQICAYLLNTSEKALVSKRQWKKIERELLKNAVLILEGFDELCMLEGVVGEGKMQYFQNLYQELKGMDCGCKIIVTTRPEYFSVEKLDFPKAHLTISPFKEQEREEFLKKYEKFFSISSNMRKILVNGNVSSLDGIIDSPLTLYMIIARNVQISDCSNLWCIYHEIFAKEVYERDYENGSSHAINEYKEQLYRLTAEIANAIAQERHLSITVNKLLDIKQIRNLLNSIEKNQDENTQDILENCFGLASYFRISEKSNEHGKTISAVEFYHNNIKDYFYCEYLWLRLEKLYDNIPADSLDRDRWFIGFFQEMFQYSVYLKDSSEGVRSRAIDFFESKILYLKENNIQTDFINQELHQKYFTHFFGKMLQTGFLCHYEYTGKENILQMMACIYASVLSIYHTIYLPYLSSGERISLAEDSHVVDIGTSFIYRILFIMSNIHDLSYVKFDGIMLSGINFGTHNFQNSSFRGCLLIGCDFGDCDLRGADFSAASLQRADFRNAIIDDTTVFSKTTRFERTKIKREQQPYFDRRVDNNLFFEESDWVTYLSSASEN